MADLYQRDVLTPSSPIVADKCTLDWEGVIMDATNVSLSYAQQITRRRTIGHQKSVIHGSQPTGQLTIQRVLVDGSDDIFGKGGWDQCTPANPTLNATGCASAWSYKITGALVSQYTIQMEAEGLTVMDNVVVDFLQVEQG
jgi:hypothetical protein